MIVADASAVFQLLDGDSDAAKLAARLFGREEPVCAPYLIDAEIAHVLRKNVLAKRLEAARTEAALQEFLDLTLVRFPHGFWLPRAFALRHTMTAYDALYVALAESLDATLVTSDGRLARAAEGIVAVEVF